VQNRVILERYDALSNYIGVVDGNEQTIMSVLPKVEITKFLEENKQQFDNLKVGVAAVKEKHDGLDMIVGELKNMLEKMNFSEIASQYYRKLEQMNKNKILDEIFAGTFKLV